MGMLLGGFELAAPRDCGLAGGTGRRWPVCCLAFLLVLLVLSGCATPIGAERVAARRVYRELTKSALEGHCSDDARSVLHRHNLEKQYAEEPAEALRRLHETACRDDRRDLLYALAELNYLEGERRARSVPGDELGQGRDFHLAAAVYAWFFLMGDDPAARPDPFDRRFRRACDLYNRAVAFGFARGTGPDTVVEPASGTRSLLPGPVAVRFNPPTEDLDLDEIEAFLPSDEYRVRGLTVRDRQSGLGAPLIGVGKGPYANRHSRAVPATLLLRADGDPRLWSAGQLVVSIELYSTDRTHSVEVGGHVIPLEADTTASVAYSLNDTAVWRLGSAQFFSAKERIKTDIYPTQPYDLERIPVLFVHGTLSSPVWWAEMWNTLQADPVLRERYQFWYFLYNSGNPVTYSAANLCDAIGQTLRQLDPAGEHPALRQMVIVGHSQGGLLAKLTAVDTGDRLWRAAFDESFESLALPLRDREAIRRNYFFAPLPSVRRVVFISTPHRGTALATSLIRGMARRVIRPPGEVVRSSQSLAQAQHSTSVPRKARLTVPTCLDGMSPRNKVLLALADTPLAPGVTGHSIIAVRGGKRPETGGDGVVKYTSAHLDGVASELVVRRSHSCQDKPETIEEVRRILLEHLAGLEDAPQRPN